MGEVADDAIEGRCCVQCFVWFQDTLQGRKPPGHPRLCLKCTKLNSLLKDECEGEYSSRTA